jgi:hypothetical protein
MNAYVMSGNGERNKHRYPSGLLVGLFALGFSALLALFQFGSVSAADGLASIPENCSFDYNNDKSKIEVGCDDTDSGDATFPDAEFSLSGPLTYTLDVKYSSTGGVGDGDNECSSKIVVNRETPADGTISGDFVKVTDMPTGDGITTQRFFSCDLSGSTQIDVGVSRSNTDKIRKASLEALNDATKQAINEVCGNNSDCKNRWNSAISSCHAVTWATLTVQIAAGGATGDSPLGTLRNLSAEGKDAYRASMIECLKGNPLNASNAEASRVISNEAVNAMANRASSVDVDAPAEANTEDDEEETSCAIDGVGWIVCPIMTFMAKLNDAAFGFLNNFLSIQPRLVTSKATQDAWAAFRDIANVAFVIAFMVIVYSQLTSAGISNYGIKRMLPRLFIAAILVNVSYWVCAIGVDISNIVGESTYTLLKDTIDVGGSGETTTGWEAVMEPILKAGAVGIGFVLLFLAVLMAPAALLAFGVILLILIARQAFVVLLIVVAPLAFVAYLLPNTESWFKKWWKAFSAVLMVFPIVALVFGASSLASKILSNVAGAEDDGTLLQIIALGVLAVPLFAVPVLLKGALSAAGNVGQKLANLSDRTNRFANKQFGNQAKDARNRFNIAAQDPENKWGRRLGGYSRWSNRRSMGRRDRETAANRSAELGYATDMIEQDADGEFSKRALKMQKAAAGGIGVANEKGQVRAEALATQRTFKQFDDDVAAFKTTQTNDTHAKLLEKAGNKSLSIEERSAAAGSIASRSFRAGHNEVLDQVYSQMQDADTELRAAEQSGDQARIASARSQVDAASTIQKQLIHDLKDKPFALGDRAMGQLGEGRFGRASEKLDAAGQPIRDASGNKQYDAPLLSPREELRVRVGSKLTAQGLATINPDDLKLIHSDAVGDNLNDSQLQNLVNQIAAARANDDTAVLIKPEASERFDEILLKANEKGITPVLRTRSGQPPTEPPAQAPPENPASPAPADGE